MKARVLCFGGRDYADASAINAALSLFRDKLEETGKYDGFAIIHGDARGADRTCAAWGRAAGRCVIAVAAPWDAFDKAAGRMRNQWMIDYCMPTHAIGFPGGAGTRDMARRVREAGIWLWSPMGADL